MDPRSSARGALAIALPEATRWPPDAFQETPSKGANDGAPRPLVERSQEVAPCGLPSPPEHYESAQDPREALFPSAASAADLATCPGCGALGPSRPAHSDRLRTAICTTYAYSYVLAFACDCDKTQWSKQGSGPDRLTTDPKFERWVDRLRCRRAL